MHFLPLDQKKLDELSKKCKHHNVSPLDFPDHCSDPKYRPIHGVLSELLDEAYEYLSIASDEEIENLLESFPSGLLTIFLGGRPGWKENNRKRQIALCYIVFELDCRKYPAKQVIQNNFENSKVFEAFPDFRERCDKDGLLYLSDEFTLRNWGIEYQDQVISYHRLFRKGYTGSMNVDFLSTFIAYCRQTNATNTFRIAIDHSKLLPKQVYSELIELDRWYGIPFNAEELDNPNIGGLTVLTNEQQMNSIVPGFDRTEFFWSHRRGIKTLQIEELSNYGKRFDHYYFNRYVHSERDLHAQAFRHLDGAIKVYLQNSYSQRIASNMPDELKSHTKIKLWRIDGDIDLEEWSDLISFFYRNNHMILEYLDPEEFKQLFQVPDKPSPN